MTNISREMFQTYLVAGTQNTGMDDFLNILEQALQAGITCFQFREKGAGSLQDSDTILKYATAAQALCRHYQVPFIIDDNLDLALQINADGIHVGQSTRLNNWSILPH